MTLSQKDKRILVVANEPAENLLSVLEGIWSAGFAMDFASPAGAVCEGSDFRKALLARGVRTIRTPLSGLLSLQPLLSGNMYRSVVVFTHDFPDLKNVLKDIVMFSPLSELVLYVGKQGLFANKNVYAHGYETISAHWADDVRVQTLVNYAQADSIIVETEEGKKQLQSEMGETCIHSLGLDRCARPAERREMTSFGIRRLMRDQSRCEKRKITKLTSIVLLCHNRLEYTKRCLASIIHNTSVPYELILVDNASTDGTSAYLRKQNGIKVIRSTKNNGFSVGCNMGIKAARGEYVLLLNNDTVVTSGWLERMILCGETSNKIGIIGPRTNMTHGWQRVNAAKYANMREMQLWAEIFRIENWGQWSEVLLVNGFCMLIKREIIDTIGLLDERYLMGSFEDYDYCLRARQKGYRIFCCGDAFVHHYGARTFNKKSAYFRQMSRNRTLFKNIWGEPIVEILSSGVACTTSGAR